MYVFFWPLIVGILRPGFCTCGPCFIWSDNWSNRCHCWWTTLGNLPNETIIALLSVVLSQESDIAVWDSFRFWTIKGKLKSIYLSKLFYSILFSRNILYGNYAIVWWSSSFVELFIQCVLSLMDIPKNQIIFISTLEFSWRQRMVKELKSTFFPKLFTFLKLRVLQLNY